MWIGVCVAHQIEYTEHLNWNCVGFYFCSDYVIMHSWVICLPVWLLNTLNLLFFIYFIGQNMRVETCYCFMQFWIFQWKLNRNSQHNANLNVNLKNSSRFSAIDFMFSISDTENMLTTRLQLPKMSISWQFISSYACIQHYFLRLWFSYYVSFIQNCTGMDWMTTMLLWFWSASFFS